MYTHNRYCIWYSSIVHEQRAQSEKGGGVKGLDGDSTVRSVGMCIAHLVGTWELTVSDLHQDKVGPTQMKRGQKQYRKEGSRQEAEPRWGLGRQETERRSGRRTSRSYEVDS
jgi:hypothetical protein